LCIDVNIDGATVASNPHTHPSHSQTSRLLTSSLPFGLLARRNHGGMHCLPRIGIPSLENKKEGKISIFLFVEKSFYERIIGEIIAKITIEK
jgi:hypothetical protein